jgi:hypothetical protein
MVNAPIMQAVTAECGFSLTFSPYLSAMLIYQKLLRQAPLRRADDGNINSFRNCGLLECKAVRAAPGKNAYGLAEGVRDNHFVIARVGNDQPSVGKTYKARSSGQTVFLCKGH